MASLREIKEYLGLPLNTATFRVINASVRRLSPAGDYVMNVLNQVELLELAYPDAANGFILIRNEMSLAREAIFMDILATPFTSFPSFDFKSAPPPHSDPFGDPSWQHHDSDKRRHK